ncbi:hypothetical protein, partial [Rhodohalobacter sulfatireducens]
QAARCTPDSLSGIDIFCSGIKWEVVLLSAVEASCFTCIDRVELMCNGQAARCTPDSLSGPTINDLIGEVNSLLKGVRTTEKLIFYI